MSMIQIRDVPPKMHRVLKARAAKQGMSLSEYLLRELVRLAQRPVLEDITDSILAQELIVGHLDTLNAVRAERDGR